MPRNGSGTYSLPAGNPVVTGTTISSSVHNTTMTDIASEMTNSLDKDGQTVVTGTIDFNAQKLVLDADGDTSIHASTDDVIDIEIEGVDAIKLGWQSVADTGFVTVDPKAFTADATENTHRVAVLNTNAITVPTGTTALASSVYITEPNITATGTVTEAATVYIAGAPTEATDNYSVIIGAGNVQLPNNTAITARNAADSADIDLIKLDANDLTEVAGPLTVLSTSTTAVSARIDTSTVNDTVDYSYQFKDSADNFAIYSRARTKLIDNTAGAATGEMSFQTVEAGSSVTALTLRNGNATVAGGLRVSGDQSSPLTNEGLYGGHSSRGAYIQGHGSANDFTVANQAGTIALVIPQNTINVEARGDLSVTGALSKGSGSFRIDHPLKPETHQLVHSFTESPQADLLYSGTSDLVDGAAEINLDEFHGMTEGTFVALNRNIRVFTTNETDWEPIKGSVTGNILSISCQDASCSDTVSWMVIGERQDQHMMDTEWTDEQGRVIVEPLKPEED